MKKCFIIFILILIPLVNYGQEFAGERISEEIFCQQLEAATSHLKNKILLEGFNLKFDNLIRDGWGYDALANSYTAKKLDVKPEELWSQDKSKIGEIFKSFEGKPFKSDSRVILNCLPKSRTANTIISKMDNNTLLFHVTTSRLGDEGSSGVVFLFFFDKSNNVESVYQTSWIS